jgi:hypothetical protein
MKHEDGCLLGCFKSACCLHHQGDITLVMEAASTSEMSVNFYQTTWRSNPEDSHLYTCCRENLKPHLVETCF